jgi:hypothetical protein
MRFATLALCLIVTIANADAAPRKAKSFDIMSVRAPVKFIYYTFMDQTTGEFVEKKLLAKKVGKDRKVGEGKVDEADFPTELADDQCIVDVKFELMDGTIVEQPNFDICSTDELLVE